MTIEMLHLSIAILSLVMNVLQKNVGASKSLENEKSTKSKEVELVFISSRMKFYLELRIKKP